MHSSPPAANLPTKGECVATNCPLFMAPVSRVCTSNSFKKLTFTKNFLGQHDTGLPAEDPGQPTEHYISTFVLLNIWFTFKLLKTACSQPNASATVPLLAIDLSPAPPRATPLPVLSNTAYAPAMAWTSPQAPPQGNVNSRRTASSSKIRNGVSSAILPPGFASGRMPTLNKNGPRHHPYPGIGATTSKKGKGKIIDEDEEVVLDFDTIFYPYPVTIVYALRSLFSMTKFRKLLSKEKNPPIEMVIEDLMRECELDVFKAVFRVVHLPHILDWTDGMHIYSASGSNADGC